MRGLRFIAISMAVFLVTAVAQAEHWSSSVPTHADGPVVMPGGSSTLIGKMANGTRRVLGTGVRIVHTGVTLPFKLGAAAVRSFSSDKETATASSSSRSRAKSDNSLSQVSESGGSLTISEWMRQPRPE